MAEHDGNAPAAPRRSNFAEPSEEELPRWFAKVTDFFRRPNRMHYCPHCQEEPLNFHMEFTLKTQESAIWAWCERCAIMLFLTGPADK